MIFVQIFDEAGRRLHVGCLMAARSDWVEISAPEVLELNHAARICFFPSREMFCIYVKWRRVDRVAFGFMDARPPDELLANHAVVAA